MSGRPLTGSKPLSTRGRLGRSVLVRLRIFREIRLQRNRLHWSYLWVYHMSPCRNSAYGTTLWGSRLVLLAWRNLKSWFVARILTGTWADVGLWRGASSKWLRSGVWVIDRAYSIWMSNQRTDTICFIRVWAVLDSLQLDTSRQNRHATVRGRARSFCFKRRYTSWGKFGLRIWDMFEIRRQYLYLESLLPIHIS